MTAGIVAGPVPRDAVLVTGADAAEYLQGQISQDVDTVAKGASAWSLVLAPQGKVDAWFRLTGGTGGSFVLDVDAGVGETLVTRLERTCRRISLRSRPRCGPRSTGPASAGSTFSARTRRPRPACPPTIPANWRWPA